MFDPLKDIKEFHEKFELTYDGGPRSLPDDLEAFRIKFMREEIREYESTSPNLVFPSMAKLAMADQLDALVDLVYVALGTAYLHGYDFAEAWRRVHAANMTKIRVASPDESKRGSAFDVVKPAGFVPPDHSDLV